MSKSSRASANNRANQMNKNNSAYQASRIGGGASKPALDNRSIQLNTQNAATKPAPTSPSATNSQPNAKT